MILCTKLQANASLRAQDFRIFLSGCPGTPGSHFSCPVFMPRFPPAQNLLEPLFEQFFFLAGSQSICSPNALFFRAMLYIHGYLQMLNGFFILTLCYDWQIVCGVHHVSIKCMVCSKTLAITSLVSLGCGIMCTFYPPIRAETLMSDQPSTQQGNSKRKETQKTCGGR